MATIGKIRERSGLVIGIIGLAMLGFIATDLLSNKLFSGGRGAPKGVGRIYGDYIDVESFREKLDPALKNQAQQKKGQPLSAAEQTQINDQVWNDLVDEKILEKEAKILGIDVTGEEIEDLCYGPNPDQMALQYLADPKTKQINRPGIKNFIQNIESAKPEQQEFWKSFETYLVSERMRNKYKTLVRAGVYVTDLEMEDDYIARNKMASIQFVPLFLNTTPDSTVNVTDDDLKSYFKKHKEDYKREESRTFEYVSFDVRPSKEDTANTLKSVINLEKAFKDTKEDSSFVVGNGKGTYSNQFQGRGSFGDNTYLSKHEDSIFTFKKEGDFIGPYYEDGSYKLAKIVEIKDDSLFYMRASHILFKKDENAVDKKADSIDKYNQAKKTYDEIKKGADFAKLAGERGTDGTASKGGDLGWFKEGAMVKRFGDAVKNGHNGELLIVSTEFGTHVVKITAEKSKKVAKVALLDKPVTVSGPTNAKAYALATSFRAKAVDGESFDATVKKMNLNKREAQNVKPNQHDLPGLDNPKELIKWAYDDEKNKEGSVSDPYRVGDKYVVAKLMKIYKDGYAEFEDVKKEIKPQAQHEKKKQMLADQFKKAMETAKTLEDIAKAVKSTVNSADAVTFSNSNIQNVANEPELSGTVAGLTTGKISEPIQGQNGVYVVKITNVNSIKAPTNFDKDRKMQIGQVKNSAEGESKEALKKKAEVKDFRYIYF